MLEQFKVKNKCLVTNYDNVWNKRRWIFHKHGLNVCVICNSLKRESILNIIKLFFNSKIFIFWPVVLLLVCWSMTIDNPGFVVLVRKCFRGRHWCHGRIDKISTHTKILFQIGNNRWHVMNNRCQTRWSIFMHRNPFNSMKIQDFCQMFIASLSSISLSSSNIYPSEYSPGLLFFCGR